MLEIVVNAVWVVVCSLCLVVSFVGDVGVLYLFSWSFGSQLARESKQGFGHTENRQFEAGSVVLGV